MFNTETHYEVVTFSIGDTKSGTKMGKLQLKDPNDNTLLNCILWEETLNRLESKIFRCGNILRIVSATFNERYNNCLISSLELVKEAKMGLEKDEQEKYWNKLQDYIKLIKNENLKNFVSDIYAKNEKKIKISPAAKMMHHNYIGGLMVHTFECLEFAKILLPSFIQKVNQDNVYTACLLHDIGKIFEYTVNEENGLIDYDENFRKDWVSHTQYGFSLCMLQGFKEVAKMIAAHHARADWGAIIDLNERELSPQTYLIHHLDDLSAKFGRTSVQMLEEA